MPDSWKTIPINAGFLVTLVVGVGAVVLTMHSIQLWVDSRVDIALDRRVSPVERGVSRINAQLDQIRTTQETRNTAEWEERRRMMRLLERLEARIDESEAEENRRGQTN